MMKTKKQAILFLISLSALFAYGQEAGQETARPSENAAVMIKEVLGHVYVQVGHIPESQWFEMEPVAEVYVRALLKARAMADDKAATLLAAEARKAFEAAIDAKLTAEQKNAQAQWKAEADAEAQDMMDFIMSPSAIKSVRQQMKSENGIVIVNYD